MHFDTTIRDSIATYPYLHLAAGLPLLAEQVARSSTASTVVPDRRAPAAGSRLYLHPTLWAYLWRSPGPGRPVSRPRSAGPQADRSCPYDAAVDRPGRDRAGSCTESDGWSIVAPEPPSQPGALVISLDFELHWGMRDHVDRSSPAYADLADSRRIVTDLADLFAERGIRATWATVGSSSHRPPTRLAPHLPDRRPAYDPPISTPTASRWAHDEEADPEHLAGSLVRRLAATPGQEVASHTFSHFYCLEDGQDEDDLRADLAAAQAIAGHHGLADQPGPSRNQWNPHYAGAVLDSGFTCFRGPSALVGPPGPLPRRPGATRRRAPGWRTPTAACPSPDLRLGRLRRPDGPVDVPASAFLRPYSPGRQSARAAADGATGRRHAARRPAGPDASTCGGTPTTSPPIPSRTSPSSTGCSTSSTPCPDREGCARCRWRVAVRCDRRRSPAGGSADVAEPMSNGQIRGESQL